MKNVINTPFGNFLVKRNNKIIDFLYSEKHVEYQNQIITLYLIDIDTINMNINDVISCGFEKKMLEFNDADERADILSIENEKLILGLCGFVPQFHGEEELLYHSFRMEEEYDGYGFTYYIERNPKEYINEFYKSKVITLAICWIEKSLFEDPDTAIFLLLTDEIF